MVVTSVCLPSASPIPREAVPALRPGVLVSVLLGLLSSAPQSAAQWVPTGAPLCLTCGADFSTDRLVMEDGQGGLFAAWREGLHYPVSGDDVFLQRITSAGYIAPGWPADGLGICVAERDQIAGWTSPDGQGGALVTWIDQRGDNDIYVQRVMGGGTLAPGWPVNGVAATQAPHSQGSPVVAPDGVGGAFVAWDDQRDEAATDAYDVYAQHLDATGAVAPGWPLDGLPVAVAPDIQAFPNLLPDGQGGVIIAWSDGRSGALDTYGVRLTSDGTIAAGWAENGTLLVAGRDRIPHLLADEAGGFYLVCSTESQTNPGFAGEYWAQRFTLGGVVVQGWPKQGLLVCQAPGPREGLRVASDGAGGVLMTWYDYRISGGVIFAARVLPSATLAPGWTPNGTLLSDPTAPGVEYDPAIASDGAGGAYVVWEKEYSSFLAYVQHLTATGQVAPGWPQFGIRVAPTGAQFHPQIVDDGAHGAIVVWDEANLSLGRLGLYAQKFRFDGPVPALLALARAVAEPGVVRLAWQGAEAQFEATVERRSELSPDWLALAQVVADGSGRVSYEDRAVESGARYAYRLSWREDGTERTTTEAWVEVPRALALALEGFRPNPAVRELSVSLTLPSAAPARLELLDVAGRQRLVRELGDLGPGRHLLRLGAATQLESGVYWLRLSQRGERRLARGAIVR